MDPSASQSQNQGYYANNMNSGMVSNNNNIINYNMAMQQPMYMDPNSIIPPVLPQYPQPPQHLPNYPAIYTSTVLPCPPPPGVVYDGNQMQSPQMFQQQQQQQQYYNPSNGGLMMQPVSYVPTTTVYDSNAVYSNINGYNSNSNSYNSNINGYSNSNNYNNSSNNSNSNTYSNININGNSNSGMMMDTSSAAINQQYNPNSSLIAQPQPVSLATTSSSTTSASVATSAAAVAPIAKLTADGVEPALLTPEEITKKLEDNDINLQAWEALLDKNQNATETVCAEDVAKHKELRQKIYENIDILRKIVKKQIKKTDAT